MTCLKCHGLMVSERVDDSLNGLTGFDWRCLNCGQTTIDVPMTPLVPFVVRHTRTVRESAQERRNREAARARYRAAHPTARRYKVGVST